MKRKTVRRGHRDAVTAVTFADVTRRNDDRTYRAGASDRICELIRIEIVSLIVAAAAGVG